MIQISDFIYCDDSLEAMDIPSKLLPNPYHAYPYLIIEDFFPLELCHTIVKHYQDRSVEGEEAKVRNMLDVGIVKSKVIEKIRKTKLYELEKYFLDSYNEHFSVHQARIEEFFNLSITVSTEVQVLEYQKGNFYVKHADDSNEIVDKDGNTIGFNVVNPTRQITTVLFTSSCVEEVKNSNEFSGGELVFNYLYDADGNIIKLAPKAGTLVCFLSNPYFSHEVLPVKDGYRMTLVQWHNTLCCGGI